MKQTESVSPARQSQRKRINKEIGENKQKNEERFLINSLIKLFVSRVRWPLTAAASQLETAVTSATCAASTGRADLHLPPGLREFRSYAAQEWASAGPRGCG